MNRRDFLKISVVGGSGIIFSPLLNACSAAAAPVVEKAAITVATWFAQYMVQLAAEKAFNSIVDFVQNQTTSEASKINDVNNMMSNNGFNNFDGRKVYQRNGIYTYEVGHKDQFNGCAAFFDGQKNNLALVEGPSVVGLAEAAEAYRNNGYGTPETASALLLTGYYQKPTANAFGKNYDQPYVGYTDYGTVSVNYSVTGSNTGQVQIIIADRQAAPKFSGTYDLVFS